MPFLSSSAVLRENIPFHGRNTDSCFRTRHDAARANHREPAGIVIIGGGLAGMRTAREVARRGLAVTLFNGERRPPYDRTRLTGLLADEFADDQLYQPDPPDSRIIRHDGQTVVHVDRHGKRVETARGRTWPYDKLVLCMGARVRMPPIPGRHLPGVHPFHTVDDAETLIERARFSRRMLVVGGGLLGLEAARGMILRGVETIIVEHERGLMARQLDSEAGALLATQLAGLGLGLRIGCAVQRIEGFDRVEQVVLSDGEIIMCDTVVMCAGQGSETGLARRAGLAIGRGIIVNDAMQTSDPDIYAVGDCAEHDGKVYGLVAPGLEQASVAARHLAGEAVRYRGSTPATRLKLGPTQVFSIGAVAAEAPGLAWSDPAGYRYRRLAVRRGRLAGAIGVGDWPESLRIEEAVRSRRFLWPWQRWRFVRTGRIFTDASAPVRIWPAEAIVCSCARVDRGQLDEAIRGGAATAEALRACTGAGGICGSCRPLLADLLGAPAAPEPEFGAGLMAAASAAAFAVGGAVVMLPGWPHAASLANGPGIDLLWRDGTLKQVTGFGLAGLALLTALLPLRRLPGLALPGRYPLRRVVHTLSGAGLLALLFLHTGFRLGSGPTLLLTGAFLAAIAAGAVAGLIRTRSRGGRRGLPGWLHILALWPLPLLVGVHLVSVYAF